MENLDLIKTMIES